MSNTSQDKAIFPEKDLNNHDLSLNKQLVDKNANVHIFDNDDAYMLNFEKDNNEENDPRENISDLDNYDKLKDKEKDYKEKNNNICEEIDDQLNPRKAYDNLNLNTNPNSEKNSKNYNNSNNSKYKKNGKN